MLLYIDPSVTTFVIEAVAGIIIAGGAVISVMLRKAKRKINDKLGIDENRNKEVESDDIIAKQDYWVDRAVLLFTILRSFP